MSQPSKQALEVFSVHLRCLEEGGDSDLDALCAENSELAIELRQLHEEWSRMSDVMERLGSKHGTLSLQLKERYGDSVDPEISLSNPDDGHPADESSAALMSKLSSQGGSERYTTRDEIARGGMGAILRVWDEDLRRPLAMKVALRDDGETTGVATDSNSQKRLSRFLEEAQITSQLDHPGIVPVHDLGIDAEGRVYFTMQLVDGRDMRDIVALAQRGEEGWDLRRLVGVLIRVCEALAYAHSKDVVHRDIKPGNVMVGKFGEVFLMDWGLAKVMGREEQFDAATSSIIHTLRSDGSSAEHTIAGDVVGTPAFMAPEQALGRGAEVGPASDLYAVGAMLYLMLTGQIPYQPLGESVSALTILEAVKSGPPWPIQKINPEAPPELVAVCEKAMAREIPNRFTDAMDLAGELRDWLEGHAVATYGSGGVFYGLRKWVGRNKGMAGALLGIILVILGGLGIFYQQQQVSLRQKQASIDNLKEEQALTQKANREAESNLRLAEGNAERAMQEKEAADVLVVQLNQAHERVLQKEEERKALADQNKASRYRAQIIAAWFSLRLTESSRTRQRLANAEESLRGWEWGHLSLGADHTVMTPIDHPNGSVALAANDEYVVSMGGDAVVRIFDPVDWSFDSLGVQYSQPAFAGQAAIGGGRNVCALSQEGVLATAAQSNVIFLWDMDSLALIKPPLTSRGQVSGPAGVIVGMAFSSDGSLLASVDSKGGARVWEVTSKEVLWEMSSSRALTCVAFHPNKQEIAIGSETGYVDMWSFSGSEGKRIGGFVEEHNAAINSLTYSADGLLLACAIEDGEVQVWERDTLSVSLSDSLGGLAILELAAREIDQTQKLIQYYSDKKPKLKLRGHRLGVTSLAFSWDGDNLYAAGRDGTVRAWSPVDGGVKGVWHGHRDEVTGMAIISGERLVCGGLDGTLKVFDPLWDEARQQLADSEDAAVLFVGHGGAGSDLGAIAVDSNGSIHRERPESDLEAARSVAEMESGGRPVSLPAEANWGGSKRGGQATTIAAQSDAWTRGALVGDDHIALVEEGGPLSIFDLKSGEAIQVLSGHDAEVTDVDADHLGYRLITGSSDSRAIIWEGVGPGEALESWEISHGRGVVAVAIAADSSVVATADKSKALQLWDVEERELMHSWPSAHSWQIQDIAISWDGRHVAAASKADVHVFAAGEDLPVAVIGPHSENVSSIHFHPDGERLLCGDEAGEIYIWDVSSQEVMIQLSGHDSAVASLAFTDDGSALFSGDQKGKFLAWQSVFDPSRYQRWSMGEGKYEREQRIIAFFGGDMELVHQRLSEGVPGLSRVDPAVTHLLEVLAPAGPNDGAPDGE